MAAAADNGRVAAQVAKLGFVELSTRDVDALVAHYTDALRFELVERDASTAYLTTGPDHHCVAITSGEPHGRRAVGFQLAVSVEDAETGLRLAGVKAERRRDIAPGLADALVLDEPDTGARLVLYDEMATRGVEASIGTRPTKLGHVASFVPDITAMQGFYEQVLGFRWSDTVGGFFVFLRCGPDHHAVNFMESKKRSGLVHVAYESRDVSHFKDILDELARHRVTLNWGVGRHGAGHNLFAYHEDPDGNIIEIFAEMDMILDERSPHWEPRPWHEEFPMGPRHWELGPQTANQWGPGPPPELMDH